MNKIMKMFITAIFALSITLTGIAHADNVEIKLGSGDGFKVLDSGGSPLMDILSNGKVGIGTSPNYKLDVSGDINFTGSLYQNGSAFSGSAWATGGSGIYYNSGNVGIGTTSPGAKLTIKDMIDTSSIPDLGFGSAIIHGLSVQLDYGGLDSEILAMFRSTDGTSFSDVVLQHKYIGTAPFRAISVWAGTLGSIGEEQFYVGGGGEGYFAGNVGIGTTSPGAKLHIEHAAAGGMPVFIGESPVPGGHTLLQIKANTAWPDDYHLFTVSRGLTAQFYILGDGRVVSTGLATHSDERLKENITHVDNSLEKILQLKGVHFYWKDRVSRSHRQQIGLLAQEVEKVFPSTVSEDNEGYKLLNYSGLIAPVIEAIKELKKRNDEHISQSINDNERRDNTIASQREEIDILKTENDILKNTLTALVTEISDIKVALRQNNQFGAKLAKAGDLGNIGQ